MINLTQFKTEEGIELTIDTTTGESFATQGVIAKLCSQESTTIRYFMRGEGYSPKVALIKDSRGVQQECKLYDENAIYDAFAKYNPNLLLKCAKAGIRVFLHRLAGFEVTSTAIPTDPLEALIEGLKETKKIRDAQLKLEAETKELKEAQAKTETKVNENTEQISNLHNKLAALSEFVSTPIDTPEQTIRNLLAKAFQELGSILEEQGKDRTKAYAEPWRQLGLELRNSELKYDLNARYSNSTKKYKEERAEWVANGKPRGQAPKKSTRLDILERDNILVDAFKVGKKIVQDYISKLS